MTRNERQADCHRGSEDAALRARRTSPGARFGGRRGPGRSALARRGAALCGFPRRPSHPPAARARRRARLRRRRSRGADAAAAAIELLHCASLVHDDLPAFDNADLRRGKPSVHVAFGEPIAVLTGDALIVLAFETLARGFRPQAAAARAADRHRRARGRLAGRHRRRTGLGIGGRRAAGRLSARQDRRAVRRRDARRRGGGRRRMPSRGARSARRSARPTRSPTICATCCATPRSSASRSARTRAGFARTPPRSSASAAPRRGSARSSTRRRRRSPTVPGAAELRTVIRAQTQAFFPKQLARFAA